MINIFNNGIKIKQERNNNVVIWSNVEVVLGERRREVI
jgi:hypothetical protein